MKRAPWILPFVLAAVLSVAAGCAKRETPAAAGVRTQTLLLGNFAEPADLDPQNITAYTDTNIAYALFEGLTWIDPDTSQPVPAAASGWNKSPDGLVYTFHLRPDARWSDGDPVTADDFVYSFRRILLPAFASIYSYMLWPIRNAEAFNNGRITDFSLVGAKALDPATLQITLERPVPYLPALASHTTWLPVQRKTIERFGPIERKGTLWTRAGNLVGNGPFILTEWTPNSRIAVARNPRYWDAAHCRLAGMQFYPMEDAVTEEVAFRSGQLHVTYTLPISKIPAYRAETPSRIRIEPILASNYLYFNTTRPPLDNVKLRRALSMAIDREAIAKDVYKGALPPAHSLTPPNCAGYTSEAAVPSDFEGARRLLSEAGYPGGKGLPVFEVQAFTDNASQRAMVAVQAMWLRELGVRITIAPVEQKTLFQNEQSLNYTIGMCGWIADYADPNTFLQTCVTGNGCNYSGWGSPVFDRLIDESTRTPDRSRRFALFQRAEALMLAEAPLAPMTYGSTFHAIDTSVHGWKANRLGFQRYKDVWLAEPGSAP